MNNRERTRAILHYKDYDRMPVVHFGFWDETYVKFEAEGHISRGANGRFSESAVAEQLGFDFGWNSSVGGHCGLRPGFERKIIEELPNGSRKVLNGDGVIVIEKPGVASIPAEYGHVLTDRESFEKEFRHRLQFSPERLPKLSPERLAALDSQDWPVGVSCGSLYGTFRDYTGVVGSSYIYADDEELFGEILGVIGELCYQVTKALLDQGLKPDFGHFWEDICFKNGPLINPAVFEKYCAGNYARITRLFAEHGCDIVSIDCDGCIDKLLPIWLENGVNTMFPIEVGTWGSNIGDWRRKYGPSLRGVGGMDKRVFAYDYAAIDAEIERLRPYIAMGGYIPCPDHRIPPDAKWENIQYYCEKFRKTF